jgi:hypothetical protein
MSAAISSDSAKPPDVGEPGGYAPGHVVAGKFQLVRELGRGGMGVVWVAHNQVLDVHVAMKIIDLARAPNPKRLADRVLQEARASARLAHPSICRVFEFGETEQGDPFIVSELLHGETLGDVLASQPRLSATRVVQVILPIIEGLVMAHGRGVVHRDVKPENIFLSRDDVSRIRPKLLDFGIARMIDADRKLTIDGTLLGTPDYMSPEQARGESDVDVRSDIWAVCVVLYEAITGTRPFEGDNYNALLWTICQETPRSLRDHGTGDERLWKVLARGLEKERDARWSTMRQLGVALARWLTGVGVKEDVCGSALRSTWLAENGRVALSEAPPGGDSLAPEEQTVTLVPARTRPATGVFEKGAAPGVSGRTKGYWLVALAAVLALLAGSALVFAVASRTDSLPTNPAVEDVPPAGAAAKSSPLEPKGAADEIAESPSAPSAAPSAALSATPSASAPAAAPRYRPRRHDSRRLDPETYDFGF